MFRLYCPIPQKYLNNGNTAVVNQTFEENALGYKEGYHGGLDFSTKGEHKFRRNTEKGIWEREPRTEEEKNGRIHILASHDGIISLALNPDKDRQGWGLYVTAEQKDGEQYRTLYWHIETPWSQLSLFSGIIKTITELIALFAGKRVKANTIIAIAGNNGFSTGPHLHQELHVRNFYNGKWGEWRKIDPMPHFVDDDVIYDGSGDRFWFQGQPKGRAEIQKIRETIKV